MSNNVDGVRLGSLLENEESFKSYLINKLGLDQSVAEAIVNSMVHTDQVSAPPHVHCFIIDLDLPLSLPALPLSPPPILIIC